MGRPPGEGDQDRKIRKRNHQQPSNCDGGGFQSFRGTGANGQLPDNATDPVKLAQAEFRKNVATLVCTFDDSEKDPYLTYDAGKRALVIGRAGAGVRRAHRAVYIALY